MEVANCLVDELNSLILCLAYFDETSRGTSDASPISSLVIFDRFQAFKLCAFVPAIMAKYNSSGFSARLANKTEIPSHVCLCCP